MSVAKYSARYLLAKFGNAVEAVLKDISAPAAAQGSGSILQRFQDAYRQQMTSVMAITGAAMSPALNAEGLQDGGAFEKLVVRLIPRPGPRSVAVGDVVAFSSPLDPNNTHSVMVRRVAALEGHTMLSSDDAEVRERVPPGHCWVLADNEVLAPPDVIDSRAFGYLDMRLIMGRVIYKIRNAQQHGPVANSPQAEAADAAVIDSEVDVEALAAGMPEPPQAQAQQQQQAGQQQQQQQQEQQQEQ